MLYGSSQQQNALLPGVILKNLNIKFANANGLETSVFEVPVEVDLFADLPGARYAMDFSSTVRVYTGAGSVKKTKAELSNIRIPAFASKMSVRRSCMYGNCTDDWISPTSSHTLELGNLGYDLCGRSNIEIRFKDAADKYVSTTVPVIQSGDQWNAYIAKMPNLICSSQKLTNTNAADGPQLPSILPTPGSPGASQSLSVLSGGKLYSLSKVDGTGTDKIFQMHIFTPSTEGGSWAKPSTSTMPIVRNSEEFVSTGGILLLTTTKNNNDGTTSKEYWNFDVTNSNWILLSNVSPPNDNSNWECYDQQGYGSLPMTVANGKLARLCRPNSGSYGLAFIKTGLKSHNSTGPIQVVAGGERHTCAYVPAEGISPAALKCWGNIGYTGALHGDPNDTVQSNTKTVTGITPIALSAGQYHSCAKVDDGGINKLKCWGSNNSYSLGNGSMDTNVQAPAFVKISDGSDLEKVSLISTQQNLSCSLTEIGKVYCWGNANLAGLPNGGVPTATEMTQFSSISGITDLAVGAKNVCVLAASGVHCIGKPSADATTAVDQNITNAEKIAAGDGFVCALRSTGTAKEIICKGDGFAAPQTFAAAQLGGNPTQLIAGQNFACILNDSGDVFCWRADNSSYTASMETSAQPLSSTPSKITGITAATKLSSGGAHACASVSDGLKCFGRNDSWQLGTSPNYLTVQEIDIGASSSPWGSRKIVMDSNAPQITNQGGGCGSAPISIGNDLYFFNGKHLSKVLANLNSAELIATYPQGSASSCGEPPIRGNDGFYFEQYVNNTQTKAYAFIPESGPVEFKPLASSVYISSYDTKMLFHTGEFLYTDQIALNINTGTSLYIDLGKLRPGASNAPAGNKYFSPLLKALIPGFGIYIFNGMDVEYGSTGTATPTLATETWRINFLDKIAADNL